MHNREKGLKIRSAIRRIVVEGCLRFYNEVVLVEEMGREEDHIV